MMHGLNAGAATFTPGGREGDNFVAAAAEEPVQPDDVYYTFTAEDEAWMEEIHAEMEQSIPQQQEAAVVLPPHAEEFWFPECRNCTCCHGYKHGCGCCITQGMTSCKCGSGGVAATISPTTANTTRTVPTPPQATATTTGPKRKSTTKPLCKFFTSPGGCRFGDKCRFAHA